MQHDVSKVSAEVTIPDNKLIGIPNALFERMTFESFDENGVLTATHDERISLQMALSAARDFAEVPEKWLCLHGPTGVGKTHLAVAIANLRSRQSANFRIYRVPDLLNRMRFTLVNRHQSTYYKRFDALRNTEMLILDDFVQPHMTDWELRTLYELVTYRHDRLLPTVITSQYIIWEGADNSNWNRVRGKHQWESIRSRLSDSRVVTERLMAAPDYRNRGA